MIGGRRVPMIVAIAALTSCSAGNESAPTTTATSAATTTTTPPTTSAVSATTASPTTDSPPSNSATSPPTSVTAPSSTLPPDAGPAGTDVAAVTPVLQSLVNRHDAAVAAVLADPRVALEAGNALVEAYLELFTPGASFPAVVVSSWQREADEGRFYRPGPRGVMRESTVMSVSPVSDDEVEIAICSRNSVEITNEAGVVLEAQGGVSAGQLTATRVDGVWLLRELSQASAADCPAPAGGS